jgi:Co/Zn/Cd efflux system component
VTPAPDGDRLERRTLLILLGINAAMFIGEQAAGWLVSSAGLLADSLDMLADASIYGIAVYAVGTSSILKRRAAHLSGWLQLALALVMLAEVARRFVWGSEPEPSYMMAVAFIALAANVTCLALISRHREGGVHMRASWIFSTNDVIANVGVIGAGMLVAWTGSRLPDLAIGAIVAFIVAAGALRILRLR